MCGKSPSDPKPHSRPGKCLFTGTDDRGALKRKAYQGESVDLHVNDLHLPVSHFTCLALVLFVGLQVGAEPLQLKGPVWVVAVIHFIQAWQKKHTPGQRGMAATCALVEEVARTGKLVEMVPNVVGLVIVPSVLVVNELYTFCKDERHRLGRETGSVEINDCIVCSL